MGDYPVEITPTDDDLTTSTQDRFGMTALAEVLEALFPNRTSIIYRALVPGLSGSSVLLAYPHAPEMQKPCVVKIGPVEDVRLELDAYRTHVQPYLRGEYIPGILSSYTGDVLGGVTYEFFAKATLTSRLRELAEEPNTRKLSSLVANLLTTIGEAWHVRKDRRHRNLLIEDYTLTERDITAFEKLCTSMPPEYKPSADEVRLIRLLWNQADSGFHKDHYVGFCHGDLHGENVLVNPNDRFCLIDFSRAKPQHYLRDFVTIEGDLVIRLFPANYGSEAHDTMNAVRRIVEASAPPFRQSSGYPAVRRDDGAVAPAVAVLRQVRRAAWSRMENQRSEIASYQAGLIRRLVRTVIRPENRITDAQRWAGVHLALGHARSLAEPIEGRVEGTLVLASHSTPRRIVRRKPEQSRLAGKVRQARYRQRPSFVLIGGVYLDVMLNPIETTDLRPEEWSNLDPVKIDLGGSCLQVGRALCDHYDLDSVLLTSVGGSDDPLSVELRRRLERERWLRNANHEAVPGVSAAVSLHLQQGSGDFTTIFTHRGSLDHLRWARIWPDLLEAHETGGVVYLAGYFRTGLHAELSAHLGRLGPEQIVAIDHGRLVPEVEHPQSIRTLKQAFRRGEIDIYICTLSELWSLVKYPNREDVPKTDGQSTGFLQALVAGTALPPLTVVRDESCLGRSTAWLLVGATESAREISITSERDRATGPVGMDNVFNAGFLYSLVTGDPELGLEDAIVQAVIAGLTLWREEL